MSAHYKALKVNKMAILEAKRYSFLACWCRLTVKPLLHFNMRIDKSYYELTGRQCGNAQHGLEYNPQHLGDSITGTMVMRKVEA